MGLKDRLSITLKNRIVYDEKRETVFYNFQGLHIREQKQIDELFDMIDSVIGGVGEKVFAIANYDNFHVEEDLLDVYKRQVERRVTSPCFLLPAWVTGWIRGSIV